MAQGQDTAIDQAIRDYFREAHIMAEVIRLQTSIAADEAEIATLEDRINQTIYRLHKLTREEIALIEGAAR